MSGATKIEWTEATWNPGPWPVEIDSGDRMVTWTAGDEVRFMASLAQSNPRAMALYAEIVLGGLRRWNEHMQVARVEAFARAWKQAQERA